MKISKKQLVQIINEAIPTARQQVLDRVRLAQPPKNDSISSREPYTPSIEKWNRAMELLYEAAQMFRDADVDIASDYEYAGTEALDLANAITHLIDSTGLRQEFNTGDF